jgi:hypothetical protein
MVGTNDSAITMSSDMGAEAVLTIGAYTPNGAQDSSINNVVIKGDEVSTVNRFYAGAAISASDTLSFASMVTESTLTVSAQPAATETIELVIGENNYTVNFVDAASDATFTAFAADIDRRNATGTIATDLATLFASIANIDATAATNVVTISPTAGGTNEFNMTLSARSFVDGTGGDVAWAIVNQQAVVVPCDNSVQGFGYYLAGVFRDTVSGASIGDYIEVETSGIVTCDTTNGGNLFQTGFPVYMNGDDGITNSKGFITSEVPSASGEVIYQVGILLQYDSGTNTASVMLQPQFITEIA